MSKILNLEHIYLDYYYFSSMDFEKRRKMMEGNYLKRNVFIRSVMQAYEREYASYRNKCIKLEKRQSTDVKG